ncbi:GNAT family N-acetyltransferase [Sciscionella sediminilitoris]|uniref:GNAT family N-acetyltransferase n=1 Tax=Sciscionella sediminilitoris TaxID=1445613 RepID=UPI00068D6B74|nr:GNAT family N-acetyltransferase [Sciscionella sp. SE31]
MRIRPARAEDAALLLELRNDPDTRRYSVHTGVVTEQEHRAWLQQSLTRTDRILLIAEQDGEPIGTVRFDLENPNDREEPETWELSITLAPDKRGRGLAGPVLHAAQNHLTEQRPVRSIRARVRTGNTASLALFARAGYRQYRTEDGFVLLELAP